MTYLFFRNTKFYMQTSQKLAKFEIFATRKFIILEYTILGVAGITAFAIAKMRIITEYLQII